MRTLFFNLHLLEQKRLYSADAFVETLKLLYLKKYLPSRRQKYKPLPNLAVGTSFLLNPGALFTSDVDVIFKAQYIRLAGRRDYTAYKSHRATYLDLTLYTDLDYNSLKHNPLLKIQDNKLYFKYEGTN